RPTRNTTPPAPVAEPPVLAPAETPPDTAPAPLARTERIFVQVGAFGDRSNAERRLAVLAASGIDNAFIHEDLASTPPLLRVRIGPVAEVIEYDILVEQLENIGITDPYLVAE
ncbi:MAG: SPOR domain-containing protein, partial [Gammaproteobacteria bacterium]|nr:SPOR domain-containing protein [Gammaproteobacteria bacterium]